MGWFRHKQDPFYAAAMADFAGGVDRLQDGDLMYLRSAWDGAAGPAQHAAQVEVARALGASDRGEDTDNLEAGLARWAGSVGRTTGYATWVSPPGLLMETDLRRQALPALWDAGRAILASDLITREAYETLMEPWRSLSEAPDAQDATNAESEAEDPRAARPERKG